MRAEYEAFVGVLESAGLVVYDPDSTDPLPEMPYVEVTPGRNEDEQVRESAGMAEVLQFGVCSVGETRVSAMWADERVEAALRPDGVGLSLTVPGRSCSPLVRRASDLSPDDTLGRVWELVTSYRFSTRPL